MIYFLYKITNIINGKIYIGVHKTQNIDDSYMGSGTLLKRAIEKYGIENFEKEIIETFDNIDDMFNAESNIVNEDFINRDDTYNIKLGGMGGFDYINQHCGNQGERLNRHLSNDKRKLGGINRQKKMGNIGILTKERRKSDPEFDQYIRERCFCSFKGKKHTEEAKGKIGKANSIKQTGKGNSQYGKMWIHNLELKESKRILKDDPIPEGWLKGRKIKF